MKNGTLSGSRPPFIQPFIMTVSQPLLKWLLKTFHPLKLRGMARIGPKTRELAIADIS